MDKQDFDLVKALRRSVVEGNEDTARLLSAIVAREKRSAEVQEKMLEAFNRLAAQMEVLTQEVSEMRREMTPPLDKPKRGLMPAPKTAKG
jgi:hypothetical protein